jgi:curli biogenesis system outer membrane secretion channel CsgG
MRRLAIAVAATALTGCVSPGTPEFAVAIAAERAAQARCPKNEQEIMVLLAARIVFDAATNVSVEDRASIAAQRAQTDRICLNVVPQ